MGLQPVLSRGARLPTGFEPEQLPGRVAPTTDPADQGAMSDPEILQWRISAKNARPAPGSADRILTYDNKVPNWEGEDIPADAAIPEITR